MLRKLRDIFVEGPIARRLIIYVVLFSSLITLVATAIQLYIDYKHDLSEIENDFEQIETAHLQTLVHSVWVSDNLQIETQLAGLLRLPDMEYLAVEADGVEQLSVGALESRHVVSRDYPLVYRYRDQDMAIGVLHAVASLDNVYARLINKALLILVSNAIKTFLVSGFILLVFYTLVTRRLHGLSQFVRDLDLDQSVDPPFRVSRSEKASSPDELDQVIGALNEMQSNLKASHDSLVLRQQAIDSTDSGIMITDPRQEDNPIVYANPATARMTGYTIDEMIGRNPRFLQGKDRDQPELEDIRAALQENRSAQTILRNYRKDGSLFLEDLHISPVRNDQGDVTHFIGIQTDITERVEAQKALRQSEARFRDFADATSDWFWETDPDHRFSYVSPRLTQVSGVHTEDYIGRSRTEVSGNLEDSANWKWHRKDLEARRPFRDFTYARQLPEGEVRHFKTSGKPIFDEDGQFLGYRGTGSDVTVEIEREKRERESETRLIRAIEAVPAAFALFDVDDRLVMCNKTQRDIYGSDRVSLVPGTRFEDLAHAIAESGKIGDTADDAEVWLTSRLDRRSNPAQGYTFKHGDDRWTSVTDHFLPDGSSITLGVDVTDLKRSEEAVREREERLRSILETAPDAIITIDDHGLISSFSPYAETMFGYSAVEAVGQNVKMLMPSPYRQEHDRYLAHYRNTGEKKIIGIGREVSAQRKDGSIFPMFLAVNEMAIEGRRMFTGVLRDMTEEKARDAQLRQAQKMEVVGQLTGGVAHDFNNLLTAIMGNLEMLEMRLDGDDKSRVMIEAAQEAAGLGAELTGRLLAFARRQPLDPKVIALNDIVLDMRELLERTLGETIEINTVLANPLNMTLADPAQVQNALLNLAINARDAMPSGGQLTLETANVELDEAYARDHADVTAGDYVLLSVSDTGTGMTPEIRDRVFEPFFTTKEVGKGSGLGLSMVYGFIKQSGGHVLLYSEVDHGTKISLYLPKVAVSDETIATKPKSAAEMHQSRRETVLVVEDDPRVRQVTIQRLQTLGYIVLEAKNGQTALDLLKASPAVDLVFTDMIMPGGMSGTELAQEIQRAYPDVKVLLTSGYSEHAGIENDAAKDDTLWLRKPYRIAELAQKIRGVLEG
ncbi:MAG: PAS domain S-box protein [Geminicoccaceae bacterium]